MPSFPFWTLFLSSLLPHCSHFQYFVEKHEKANILVLFHILREGLEGSSYSAYQGLISRIHNKFKKFSIKKELT